MGTQVLDVSKTRQTFVDAGLPGMVALVDFLLAEEAAGRGIAKIGSASINNTGRPASELTYEIIGLPSFSLGRLDGTETPLEALAKIAERGFAEFPPAALMRADQVCAELADPDQKKPWELILSLGIVLRNEGPAN